MSRFFLVLLFLVTAALTAPHAGDQYTLKQPDGSTVNVIVWGDEYYQRIESPNGYTLVRDSEGWISYAKLSEEGDSLISTGERYTNSRSQSAPSHGTKRVMLTPQARLKAVQSSPFYKETQRTRKDLVQDSVIGDIVGLTILIDFSDRQSSISKTTLENFLNQQGFSQYGCNGSVRDYYSDVSGGKVDYTNVVTSFYRAKKPKSYYDANEQSGYKTQELIQEALQEVQYSVDFSQLTLRDGAAIALNILYAGEPDWGWAKGLWPHQFYLQNVTVGGVQFYNYQITNIGSSLKLSTFCHENGHMVGQWPDLYDYQSDGTAGSGIGHFGLMCFMGDDQNPVPPNGFFRYLVGWDEVQNITDTPEGTLLSIRPNANEGYVYGNSSNANEFFYIEARKQEGRHSSLPDEGLMIFHVDAAQTTNDYEQMTSSRHYMVSLEQADGRFNLEKQQNYSGDSYDLFRPGNGVRFTDETSPNANWWNGYSSGLHIANISPVAETMTFTIGDSVATTHLITTQVSTGGTITPDGEVIVNDGADKIFIATADSGYVLADVVVDDSSWGAVDTVELTAIGEDHTIKVIFAEDNSLTILAPNGSETLPLGSECEISWNGTIVDSAEIVLLDGATEIQTIAVVYEGNSYLWTIDETLAESNSYRVAITDNNSSDTSDAPFTIKEIIMSENLLSFGDWYVIHDEYEGANGSTAELDTTGLSTESWIGGTFTIGEVNETADIYPYGTLVSEISQSLEGVTAITVTYKCDAPYTIALNQAGLDTLGESYIASLPASPTKWNTVTLTIADFAQPDWVTGKTPLNLTEVFSMGFSIDNEYGRETAIKIKNLQLYDFEPQEVALSAQQVQPSQFARVTAVSRNAISLETGNAGLYTVELFSISGRRIFSKSLAIDKRSDIQLNTSLSPQVLLLQIRSKEHQMLKRIIVQ